MTRSFIITSTSLPPAASVVVRPALCASCTTATACFTSRALMLVKDFIDEPRHRIELSTTADTEDTEKSCTKNPRVHRVLRGGELRRHDLVPRDRQILHPSPRRVEDRVGDHRHRR